MWLLDAKTYRLKFFHEATGYAILSHTWGNEEVSFQQIQDLEAARRLRGFEKIRLTCTQALEDGLSYAWVDTCCIDKKSSAELSEAINSMFRYYTRSTACYVYLSDVTTTRAENFDVAPDWLAKSRWFTRGWTLQELIAPSKVLFFSTHWRQIGSKHDLAICLAEITGIHLPVLRSSGVLGKYSGAQRMSWAAHRETTRPEDRAYSLLGLFDINMPLLYGEGEKAFARLQQEIIKSSEDHSIFLWSSPHSHLDNFNILAPNPGHFRDAGKIVTVKSATKSPFEFTNSGLRIELCETSTREGKFLVFNCRYCDDFRGRLALTIKHTEVEANSNVTKSISVPRHALSRSLRRVIPDSNSEVLEPRTCILADHALDVELPRTTASSSLWFREAVSFSSAFWISEAHPRRNWNEDSGVMQSSRGEFWGYITWRRLKSRFAITMIFKSILCISNVSHKIQHVIAIAYTRHGLSARDCERWATATEEPGGDVLLYHIPADSIESSHFTQQIVPFEGPAPASISARKEEIMEEAVCVIDITLEGTAVSPCHNESSAHETTSPSRKSLEEEKKARGTNSIEDSGPFLGSRRQGRLEARHMLTNDVDMSTLEEQVGQLEEERVSPAH